MKLPILERPANARLLALTRKVDEYLLKSQSGTRQQAGSLGKSPSTEIQKKHVSGLRIKGTLKEIEQRVTLQISLDPLRFESWTKSMGPVDVFYMDPYGIEIFYEKRWFVSIDSKVVPFKDTAEIYEMARIDVESRNGERTLLRIT
jgi:hypothetical protein